MVTGISLPFDKIVTAQIGLRVPLVEVLGDAMLQEVGPLALERLCVGEDGKHEYRTRKGQVLRFTAEELVKQLVALIPTARTEAPRNWWKRRRR